MCQDSQVKHFDHVDGSHAPLNAESQVLTGELIDNVTDLEHAPRHVYSHTVDAWRQNRSSTGAQAHNHAAFSPRPPRGLGNTLTGTAQQRGTQYAEKTPDQPGSSQPRAGAPARRRLADTQHAAGLGHTHALASQRLCLLQLHDNLLRRVLHRAGPAGVEDSRKGITCDIYGYTIGRLCRRVVAIARLVAARPAREWGGTIVCD